MYSVTFFCGHRGKTSCKFDRNFTTVPKPKLFSMLKSSHAISLLLALNWHKWFAVVAICEVSVYCLSYALKAKGPCSAYDFSNNRHIANHLFFSIMECISFSIQTMYKMHTCCAYCKMYVLVKECIYCTEDYKSRSANIGCHCVHWYYSWHTLLKYWGGISDWFISWKCLLIFLLQWYNQQYTTTGRCFWGFDETKFQQWETPTPSK